MNCSKLTKNIRNTRYSRITNHFEDTSEEAKNYQENVLEVSHFYWPHKDKRLFADPKCKEMNNKIYEEYQGVKNSKDQEAKSKLEENGLTNWQKID